MSELFSQLGINWPMLLAQAVNFGVLLTVLTIFVYKPLMKAMEERRKKIELGVKGGELAEQKIAEAEAVGVEKMKAADREAIKIVGVAEQKATTRGLEITRAAEHKGDAILADAAKTAERKKAEEMIKLEAEAARLVKAAIDYALAQHRKSLTIVHKGNIMKFTEGAFRDWGYAAAEKLFGNRVYTWAQWERSKKAQGEEVANREQKAALAGGALLVKDAIADITLQQVLTRPEDFDVIA
ncbi:MAG: isocitrate/isopropylmalate family dehydrogenase, partial [Candidatus Vogelbacteria bacterium]|nr:isocitrate/isopropylmalate family dehydrogenase [Candidatus Vogelbacteria bacterium]